MYICIYAYTKQVGSFVTILQRIESIRIISYLCYAYRRICVNFSTDNAPTNKYYFLLIFFFSVQLFIIYYLVFASRVTYIILCENSPRYTPTCTRFFHE